MRALVGKECSPRRCRTEAGVARGRKAPARASRNVFLVVATLVSGILGCVSGADVPSPGSEAPVVGHVRLRGRTIDLTVETVDARSGLPELRRTTAQRDDLVWAGTDDSFFEPETP